MSNAKRHQKTKRSVPLWFIRTTSSITTIRNAARVRRILQDYQLDVVFNIGAIRPAATLEVTANNDWPGAQLLTQQPTMDAHKRERVFRHLLVRLAPYLRSRLLVQAVAFSDKGTFGAAKEWTVQPGATRVRTRMIKVLPDQNSPSICRTLDE